MTQRDQTVFLIRNSDASQDLSLASQREQCEHFAAQHGLAVLRALPAVPPHLFDDGAFVDDSVSGTRTDKRPGFQAMLSACQARNSRIRYVVCYDTSRFGRFNLDEAGHYRHLLWQAGVQVITVVDGFVTDDAGGLMRGVQQWQGHQYVKHLSRVTQRGQIRIAELGFWSGGTPPYGYDLAYEDAAGVVRCVVRFQADGTKHVLNLDGSVARELARDETLTHVSSDRARLTPGDPARVGLVRQIFDQKAAGWGYKRIAAELNRLGVPVPRNRKWSAQHKTGWSPGTIKSITSNPVYLGHLVFNRTSASAFYKIRKSGGAAHSVSAPGVSTSKITRMPDADWVVATNAHPGLISQEIWDRIAAGRAAPSRVHARGSVAGYVFSGLIKCAACDHRYQGHKTSRRNRHRTGAEQTRAYVCGGYMRKGTAICPVRGSVSELDLWTTVFDIIKKQFAWLLTSPGFEAAVVKRAREIMARRPLMPADAAVSRRRIAEIDTAVDALVHNLSPENLRMIDSRLTALREEREELAAQLEAAETESATPAVGDIKKAVEAFRNRFQSLESASPELKRRFLSELVDRIDIDPRTKTGVAWLVRLPKSVRDSLGLSVRNKGGAPCAPKRPARRVHRVHRNGPRVGCTACTETARA